MENNTVTISLEEYEKAVKNQMVVNFILSYVDEDKTTYLNREITKAVLKLLGRDRADDNDTV